MKLLNVTKSPLYKNSSSKITNRLAYVTSKQIMGNIEYDFVIFDVKKNKKMGSMVCYKEKVYRRDVGLVDSLYIAYLSAIKNMGQNVGRDLFNMAKSFSEEKGCGGFIFLDSSGCMLPDKAPHGFYRKMGMSTYSPKVDKIIDNATKRHENISRYEIPIVRMYYPPINFLTPPKDNLLKRSIQYLKEFFLLRL